MNSARQRWDSISSNTVELCLGAGLCLWAARRVAGLDLLIGMAGAGLVYRSLSRRSAGAGCGGGPIHHTQDRQTNPAMVAMPSQASTAAPADRIDEASEESFPGSDPPAFTGTTASPAVPLPQ